MELLRYDAKADRLILDLTDRSTAEIDAFCSRLVTWTKQRNMPRLTAQALAIAYREVKDLFPDLVEAESMLDFGGVQSGKTFPSYALEPNTLFPVQVKPTQLLVQRDRALLTATPGLGKTVMACVALRELPEATVVIVAPLSLLRTWEAEVKKWLDPVGKVEVWEKWQRYNYQPVQVLITTATVITALYERGWLDERFGNLDEERTVLILDESFSYKNRNAKRSLSISQFSGYFRYVWMLSGMPISKFSDDLFMQLKILYPSSFRSYWKFTRRYCLVQETPWATKVVGDLPGATERLKADLADILIECDFPENIPDWEPLKVPVLLSPEQSAIYTDLKATLMVQAEVLGASTTLTLKSLLALTSGLMQAASNPALLGGIDVSAKRAKLLKMLPELGLPALVWIQYIHTANTLYLDLVGLGYRVGLLTGKVKSEDRAEIVKRFQMGELDILVLHPTVGKYGHTLTAAKVAYYLERNYDSEAFYQSLYRGRRITSGHPIKLVYLLATLPDGKPTIDHVIHKVVTGSSRKSMKLTVGELVGSL